MGYKRGRSWPGHSWNYRGPVYKRRRYSPAIRRRRRPRLGNLPRRTGYLNIERKFHDVRVASGTIDETGTIWANPSGEASLLRIPEGNSESDRLGRKITLRSLHIRGNFFLNPDPTNSSHNATVRMIVYQDRQTNGTAATPSEILEGVSTAYSNSYRNLANKSRFYFLCDKTIQMASKFAFTDTGASAQRYISFNKMLKMPIQYSDTAQDGSLGTIRSNNIGILFLNNGTLINANFVGRARVRFTDL